MNTEQEKKPVDQALTGGQEAAGELTESELEQVSGGGRSALGSVPVPKRPVLRGTETN